MHTKVYCASISRYVRDWSGNSDRDEIDTVSARTPEELMRELADWVRDRHYHYDLDDLTREYSLERLQHQYKDKSQVPEDELGKDIPDNEEGNKWLVAAEFHGEDCEYGYRCFESAVKDDPEELERVIRGALRDDLVGGALSKESRIRALQRCLKEVEET
jgi:hypothetical protein